MRLEEQLELNNHGTYEGGPPLADAQAVGAASPKSSCFTSKSTLRPEGPSSVSVLGVRVDGTLQSITLRFRQQCEGSSAALRGKLVWRQSAGEDVLTCPSQPVPSGGTSLPGWQPVRQQAGLVLESDKGDYIGGGVARDYPIIDLTVTSSGGKLELNVDGWSGTFVLPDKCTRLQLGYHEGLQRFPFHNEVKGGLDFSGNGRGCNRLSGSLAVDEAEYDSLGALQSVTLRFEQHCEEGTPALRGKLVWAA